MTRTIRLAILTVSNWLFWIVMYGLTWHHQIPEPLTVPAIALSQLFAWPLGLLCFSMWFLINAQLHTTDWRLALTSAMMLINGALWAWVLDWLWRTRVGWRERPGFPVLDEKDDATAK
jgi:hypothetical protein